MTPETWLSDEAAEEPRYDREILFKVAALAQQLQERHQETLTAREIEMIGQEIGLKPEFVRAALSQVTRSELPPMALGVTLRPASLAALACAWWSAGWAIPFLNLFLAERFFGGAAAMAGFFIGWAIYIAGGIFLTHGAEDVKQEAKASHGQVCSADPRRGRLQEGAEGREADRAS